MFRGGVITVQKFCVAIIGNYPCEDPSFEEQPNCSEFPPEMRDLLKCYFIANLPWECRDENTLPDLAKYLLASSKIWFQTICESLEIGVNWNDDRYCFERRQSDFTAAKMNYANR